VLQENCSDPFIRATGQAAAQANDRDKARHYFAKLLEMAGAGVRSSDIQAVRQHIARN
jgi:hypothetical protein